MPDLTGNWTNDRILDAFLTEIVEEIYEVAEDVSEVVFEEATSGSLGQLKEVLVGIQIGALASLFAFVDGASGPTEWPGIRLANAMTGESLAMDLRSELSQSEGRYLANQGRTDG